MSVLPWTYQLGFNGLLCLVFIYSVQQICVSSIHEQPNVKFRYITSFLCFFSWLLDFVVMLHYQNENNHTLVVILRLCIALNICLASWATYNFLVKSVDAIYTARYPYRRYYPSNNSYRQSPKWFHEFWYFIILLNIFSLILCYALAIFLSCGSLFWLFDLINDCVMILGTIVTIIALCNVNKKLTKIVWKSRINYKNLKSKNASYFVNQKRISYDELSNVRKEIKKEIKLNVPINDYNGTSTHFNNNTCNADSLSSILTIDGNNNNNIDMKELSRRITTEQQNKIKYKILKYNKRKIDLMLVFAFIFLICIIYDVFETIFHFNFHNISHNNLYNSPYPTFRIYISHYILGLCICIVLIIWIYRPSKWCTQLPRDSLIAYFCCLCIGNIGNIKDFNNNLQYKQQQQQHVDYDYDNNNNISQNNNNKYDNDNDNAYDNMIQGSITNLSTILSANTDITSIMTTNTANVTDTTVTASNTVTDNQKILADKVLYK